MGASLIESRRFPMFLSRKATVVSVTAAFSLLSLAYCEKPAGDGKPFTPVTSADSISYMIGYDVGRSLKALEDGGAIRLEGHRMVIVNKEYLRQLAGLN